ncbi:hypothetical protein cyc_08707 [Cyclospora cayetanensis]|uniref:Uncharacterized protein n=1 Tax=Cyclospora cayetanensis TaxID=88456 RepID=A0A1D3D2A2_9EIME|nr:hypothetical protein cyc_08707 [Cyclospora cayetanensis]
MSTYTCECNSNHVLDTVDGVPKSVESTQDQTLFLIGVRIVAVGVLISLVSRFFLRRRILARNAMEQYAEEGLQVTMGAQQDGLAVDASAWM